MKRLLFASLFVFGSLYGQTCDPNVTFTCYTDPAPCDYSGGYVVVTADQPYCTGASCGNGLFIETQNWFSYDVFYGVTCDSGTTTFCGTCSGGLASQPFVRPFEIISAFFKLKPITPTIYQRVYQKWERTQSIKVNRFWWKHNKI